MISLRGWVVAAGLWVSLAGQPAVASDGPEPRVPPVRFSWGIQIPMRDGVQLNGTLYLPREQAPAHCIFTMTPYVAEYYHNRGMYFASHGLAFLAIDVRGRGNSGGQFRPFIQEAQDGYDVTEWLAQQPFCRGKVAMWGGSYAGYVQWATAKERPPHLGTIVPASAPYMGGDFPLQKNIFTPYDMQWILYTSGRASQVSIFEDRAFWTSAYRALFESGRPLRELDRIVGLPSPVFQEWLSHPHPDAYWDAYNPTTEQYRALSIPILTIVGAYDDDQLGALMHYRGHMNAGTPAARALHYLIIGPWDHSGTRTPKARFGGIEVGAASLVDLPKLHADWYAWTLGGAPKPELMRDKVAYYVIGPEEWRYAATLASITAESREYFLDSRGSADDVFASAALQQRRPEGTRPDHYIYDPADISAGSLQSEVDSSDLTDQRLLHAGRGRALIYHSAPLAEDTTLAGFFKLSVWIAIDQPDTDFLASIYEVAADGRSVLLCFDTLRARYRRNSRSPELITTRNPLQYDFDAFNFVARRIAKGNRLRLVLGPLNSIYNEKNYNSGGVVAEESIKNARRVQVNVFHDGAHPSALHVPIGQRKSD